MVVETAASKKTVTHHGLEKQINHYYEEGDKQELHNSKPG